MKFFIALIAVAIGVVLSTVADVYLKESKFSNFNFIILGIILYALGALPVALAFKYVDFSVVFFIWEAMATILGVGLGIVLFKEHFSYLKFAAFASAMLALILSYIASLR
jgi:multidrug transporter EmrE-like cation transporter